MIKITVTPPNQPSFSQEFFTVSDAYDFLMTLHEQGYRGAKEAAQPGVQADGPCPHTYVYPSTGKCRACGEVVTALGQAEG